MVEGEETPIFEEDAISFAGSQTLLGPFLSGKCFDWVAILSVGKLPSWRVHWSVTLWALIWPIPQF